MPRRWIRVLAALAFLNSWSVGQALAQVCVESPAGIIAWWPLDETSGTTADDRVGDHPGAHTNGPTPADGKVGGALRFDGSNDYVTVADSDLWAFGFDNFTVELWANFDAPGGGSINHPGDIFIGNDEGPGTVNKWFFALGGGVLNFHINGPAVGSKFTPQAPFSPIVGQWYHFAVTRSGDTYTIFLDGNPAASATNDQIIPNANAPLTIGQAEQLGFMNGRLDEVAIYDRALTEGEIQAIFDADGVGKCKDLIVRPDTGGNSGLVTVRITGEGLTENSVVKLTREGEADIIGDPVILDGAGTTITTTFDLLGRTPGSWDAIVEIPSGISFQIVGGFTIEEGGGAELWVDVVGLDLIRPGIPQTYWVFVGNSGNINTEYAYALLELPDNVLYEPGVPAAFPIQTGPVADDGLQRFAYGFPRIPPGSSVAIPLVITANTLGEFELSAGLYDPSSDPVAISEALTLLGTTSPENPPYWTSDDFPPAGYIILYQGSCREVGGNC